MKKFVSPYGSTGRRQFVLFVLGVFACAVLLNVSRLGVFRADFLKKQGDSRYIRTKVEPALRGNILDRNGEPLAISASMRSISLNPKTIDKTRLPELAQALGLSANNLAKKINQRRHKHFMYVRRGVKPSVGQKVLDMNIRGVDTQIEYRRFYPSASATGQILGFTDIDGVGREGMELQYNDWLRGVDGSMKVVQDERRRVMDILQEINPPVQGTDLTLTIDKRIQYLVYEALSDAFEKHRAKTASAVVLDAETSEILAMVSVPSGNPNNPREKKPKLLRNRAVADTFEPGSTLKPLAIATALEVGVIRSNSRINTKPGFWKVGSHLVRDHRNYGVLSIGDIIKKSSNVGTAKVVMKLPKETLHRMYDKLGFGQKTAIHFPSEQVGTLRDFAKISDFDYVTNSYGYGISANVLQLAQAYAVIANNGIRVPVSLIKDSQPPVGEYVFSQRVAKRVRRMLGKVVGQGGSGWRAAMDKYTQDYTVGGKTGTSRKVVRGQYSDLNHTALFVGMAPLNNPRIVMAVMVDDPQADEDVYYGGQVAAPVFSQVVGRALRILNVAPDRPKRKDKKLKLTQAAQKHRT